MTKTEMESRVATLCRTRHLSRETEKTYKYWLGRFFVFSKARREIPSAERARLFLEDMAPHVAASTQTQALNALAFLFNQILETPIEFGAWSKAKRPKRIPVCLCESEMHELLGKMTGATKLMAQLCYGSGLRLKECLGLRIKDVDFHSPLLFVRAGKGEKDRVTCLPLSLIDPIRLRIDQLRRLWEQDRRENLPSVFMPDGLSRKYPNAGKEFPLQWVFPGRSPSKDPETGIIRRHHVHDATLQKAVKAASIKARLTKRVTVHVLRHSFATRLLETGCDIAKVAELLGHSDIRTTAVYLHCIAKFAATVKSPMDL